MIENKLIIESVSSLVYTVQEIGRYVSMFIFGILMFLFLPGRYTRIAYWEKYDLPQWIGIFGYILMILTFVLILVLIFYKFYKRGNIIISNDEIWYNGLAYKITDIRDFEVALNPIKYKPQINRTIINGGANNWLKFRYENKSYELEFLLKNKEDEVVLETFLSEWLKVKNLCVCKSKEQSIIPLFDYYNL